MVELTRAAHSDAYTITAAFGVAAAGAAVDPVYDTSSITPANVVLAPGLPITIVLPVKPVKAN